MAAGLGFKDFTTGEVLTAADVDGYLMQGVWVFASAAARDAAVTSPQEGNFAYLKDTNVTTYYTGSAWANLDTTGMTNPMTTTGDTIYSSSGSTPARLGIGSTGQVLTVAGGVPTWATPAGGGSGLTLIDEIAVSSASSTSVNDVFSSTYKNYKIMFVGAATGGTAAEVLMRLRVSGTDTTTNYAANNVYASGTTIATRYNLFGADEWYFGDVGNSNQGGLVTLDLSAPNLAERTSFTVMTANGGGTPLNISGGTLTDNTQYTGFTLGYGQVVSGTIFVYGYAKE